MKIIIKKSFSRDFKSFEKIKIINLKVLNMILFLEENNLDKFLLIFNVKKIVGFSDYYRVRIGDYRVGVKIIGEEIIFMRIKHRKDIYKIFP